ncbi:DUF5715 family protein [Edaphobacter aggregans]|uniref:DUF5715 family protein n=1 Tax=Edaphobacter aggregans TaxID=570835 RepID=UPI00054F230D|nr:DUF5715 family protein [Edaphobacter aggregans]
MRLNAPITALLALAVSLLGPASLTAATRPTHRVAAPKSPTPVAAPKKRTRRKSADDASVTRAPRNSHRKQPRKRTADDAPDRITVQRVHTAPRSAKARPATRRDAATPQQTAPSAASLITPEHRKATSQDFLDAAGASGRNTTQASLSAPRSTVDSPAPITTAPDADASQPAPVVSVTRAHAPAPQLDDVSEEAATPVILPALYNKRGRLIVPRPLKGSHEILVRQNRVADRDGLDRIEDDADLIRMRNQHLLVALPVSKALDVDDRLPADRRYCRPWTAQFLATLSRAHYARFHTPLQVNSAVRTVEFQQRLQRTNGNAAPAEGETASPHLTGQAIDIAKHGLSLTEIAWLRGYLLPLIQQGRIDVEEEFQQACFHISVYKKYTPSTPAPSRDLATSHSSTAALATAIR